MPHLVVSVRNPVEVAIAHHGGADILDLKEPQNGALGQPPLETVMASFTTAPPGTNFSLACGELREGLGCPALPATATRLRFAKAGPVGLATVDSWESHFERFRADLPIGTEAVAVAYADHHLARAPDPWDVLQSAKKMRADGFLLDTFCKNRGTVFDCVSWRSLTRIFDEAARLEIWTALAGSLTHKDLRRAAHLRPRFVAMRGGICHGGRNGTVSMAMIRNVQRELQATRGSRAAEASGASTCGQFPPSGGQNY